MRLNKTTEELYNAENKKDFTLIPPYNIPLFNQCSQKLPIHS